MLVFNSLSIVILKKMYLGFHKNIKQNNCFQHWYNTKKLFLSTKSVYQNDFWRSCDTEDWINDADNSALLSQE